jgi:uncharacterized protein
MSDAAPPETTARKWRPLEALDRRVLGVLVEKAKTTPEAYPMSLNALRTGCNQKNNRFPLMEAEAEDVEESLERLREYGAVAEVQGGGRVARFRHYLYEWLGVEKAELAVMAELLLRGAQTEGELRGRAARMEPLADLNALRPILQSLEQKGLVVSLSPAGRGHVVTHNLYQPREMEKLQREFAGHSAPSDQGEPESQRPVVSSLAHAGTPAAATRLPMQTHDAPSGSAAAADYASRESVLELQQDLEALRSEMASLRKDLEDLWSNFR